MKPIVVKIGGSTLGNHDTTLEDLVTLQEKGTPCVVVHGGGNLITQWLQKHGIASRFEKGQRVTDEESLEVVIAVLAGLVNKQLVATINSLGGMAVGLSGADDRLIQGRVKSPEMGYVGEVVGINLKPLETALTAGYIPVVAPIGFQFEYIEEDRIPLLNFNADIAAAALASALAAGKLVFLTDVPGVCDGEGKLLLNLSATEARNLVDSGAVSGGMIPKVEACLQALSHVSYSYIIDGRIPGSLLAAIEGKAVGTVIKGKSR